MQEKLGEYVNDHHSICGLVILDLHSKLIRLLHP